MNQMNQMNQNRCKWDDWKDWEAGEKARTMTIPLSCTYSQSPNSSMGLRRSRAKF